MTTTEATQAIQCMVWYHYNTASKHGIEAVYGPDIHESYAVEKELVWRKGLSAFFGELDGDHQERFVQAALDKYMPQLEAREGV
jgi:hypothetical protein